MRGAFLVLARRRGDGGAFAAAAASLTPMLASGAWRRAWSGERAIALVRRDAELSIQTIGSDLGLVIGDLFARDQPAAPAPTNADPAAFERRCRQLSRDYWGRYVAVRWPTHDDGVAAFRDPSGALDCLTWSAAGVSVIASEASADLPAGLRPSLRLDWDRVAALLADPTRSAGALALSGARAVWPGELWFEDPAKAPIQIWAPSLFASPPDRQDAELQRDLVRRVDACLGAGLAPDRTALIEVSGGLDSAIVAAAAARAGTPAGRTWLNYRTPTARGDERRFARAVGAASGFELTEAVKSTERLELASWRSLSDGVRPPLCALDPSRDRDVAARCAAAGLTRVITGQGGDVVFFQMPTTLVVADLARSGAAPGAILRATHAAARWTRQSAWRSLHQALGAKRRPAPPHNPALTETALASRADAHPWLQGLERTPPGKRLQIEALASCQSFYGDSQTARTAVVFHPLLSQPVAELCLQIPSFQLTRCRRDRAFAREAFAHRLPPSVTHRRGKGEVSSHYGRVLAASLDELRPLLMDGALAGHGLLDRARLEALLTPDSLVLNGSSFALTSIALIETWVSAWCART